MTGLVWTLAGLDDALFWLADHWMVLSIGLSVYGGICAAIGWRAAR